MIKVHKVMASGFFHTDRTNGATERQQQGKSPGDIVTISEEGKKKRVMGHVMACLCGPDRKKA